MEIAEADSAASILCGLPSLVGRQRDGGGRVGHAQQGLGQAHQGQALGAGDGVLAQQRFHRPERRGVAPHLLDPGRGQGDHALPVQRRADSLGERLDDTGLRAVGVRQAGMFGRGDKGRHGGLLVRSSNVLKALLD
jgi:hypothetical protein